MKRILLFMLCIVSFMYANDKSVLIKRGVSVDKYLEATTMETSFSIEATNKDYGVILKEFETTHLKIKELLKSTENLKCKGGQNYIDRIFKYVENKKIFDGYFGKSIYQCSFKNVDDYNKLLNISLNEKQLINLNPIKSTISNEIIEETTKKLEIELIKKTIDVVGLYSQQLLSDCIVTQLEILNGYNNEVVFDRSPMLAASKMQISEPFKENKRISLNANVEFRCSPK